MESVCTIVRNRAQNKKTKKNRLLNIVSLLFVLSFLAFLACGIGFPAQADAGQATLSWTAPTTYTDGTPVSGILGYKIFTGASPGNYTSSLDAGSVTSYTLSSLNDGTTYYFAVTAYDTSGDVSGFSNEVSFTTTAAPPPTPLYAITASAGSGGTISPSGSIAISQGLSQAFAITPATGYKTAGVSVDGASVGAVSSYTFSNVTANHTIAATFAANQVASYTISASAGTGGSISPAGTATVNSGGSQTYTIAPSTGYQIAAVTVDGASVGAVTGYSFTNVTANHTIAATFASTSPSGTITSSATWQNLPFASQNGIFTASFDMIPNAINIDAVTMLSAVAAQAYTDGAAIVRFNTTGSIDARNGGAYAAAVSVPYTAGSTYHVRMVVNVPQHVYDVYVTPPGGTEIHLAAGYAFRTEQATASVLNDLGVFADIGSHTVSNFTMAQTAPPATYSISASAGTGGSISPSGTQTVTSGGTQSYTITPSAGYTISGVTVDGTSVGAVSSYTFSNVTANHTISVSFKAASTASYTITATASAHGSISPSGTTTVSSGGSQTYTITPAARYKVSAVKVDGLSVGAVKSYSFSNVTANHTIAVSFTK